MRKTYDVAVIGGGPCGAVAAERLAEMGHSVVLVDPDNRIKPCGGAIPSRALVDFAICDDQLVARANAARIIAPSGRSVDMTIGDIGYVGMVDRATFDPYLRQRAAEAGANRLTAKLETVRDGDQGVLELTLSPTGGEERDRSAIHIGARRVIGADGANSAVRRLMFPAARKPPYVFAYHEIIETPVDRLPDGFRADRCDVIYDGRISPDFYGWVFPHGKHTSIGSGTAVKGHNIREATIKLRQAAGLGDCTVIRREGAPLPLKPMKSWDNGRNVLLAGDAAGTVAPSSGEGIYYAMLCGRLSAEAMHQSLLLNSGKPLAEARRSFMRAHGRVFFILGMMQTIWYRNDRLREKFVAMCADPDVQRLTWESYLNKKLVRRDLLAHLRVFTKDLAKLFGIPAWQR
ncbi:geranylgeranyl diphosphate reductase [Rhizobium wuzhouense]|uniref:Geranylgeranyl diphosphate reductase n=1 Tax=Rhizobium wuzhouense TaxID=1986026 RepID=A0ABX5NR69_9HYPH|nr:geranylgeranyl diphosphate reductase [Rhizobium wuzhouense]PYB71927.1 geranylgeranyl diphosphate reductase [Rhizobium wuzhouense]